MHNRIHPLSLTVALVVLWTTPARAADAEKGKAVYTERCAFCHGSSGRGDGIAGATLTPAPTNFTSPEYWKTANPGSIKAAITDGKPGTAMVAFKPTLSAAQIDDVGAYIGTFKPAP